MDPHGKHGSSIPSSSYGSVHPSRPIWERLTCTRTRLHEQHNLRMSSSLSKASEIVAMSPCSEMLVLRLLGNWTTSALCRRTSSCCRRRTLLMRSPTSSVHRNRGPPELGLGVERGRRNESLRDPPTSILSAQI